MAGVDPDLTDTFVFRYELLLVEVGGEILRKLFDDLVYHDLIRYLSVKPNEWKQLRFLMDKNIIKKPQQELLPPKNLKPCTKDFDITLTSLLLRNICGLKHRNDVVWDSPHSTDNSLEAEITRLRECRNILDHRASVQISAAEFEQMWNELCVLLNRLNSYAKINDLSNKIEDVKKEALDKCLKAELDETCKRWKESEQENKNLKRKVAVLESKNDTEKLRRDATELKDYLIKTLKKECSKLSVTALCEEDDRLELLTFYQRPDMIHKPYHRSTEDKTEYKISSFEELFSKGEHKNIFLTGDAGVGKSSLCQCMALLWSRVQSNETIKNETFEGDAEFMKTFDFVFYISLSGTCRDNKHVRTMIIELLLEFNDDKDEMKELLKFIPVHYNCLIILDGLDEWTPADAVTKSKQLPLKFLSEKCTYLTACRPYIIENERLTDGEIDLQVYISGLSESESYVEAIVKHVNKTKISPKDARDFFKQVKECNLEGYLSIPLITSQLILVWFKQNLTNMSRSVIYANIVEMLFERAEKRKQIELPSIQSCELPFPKSFIELSYIRQFSSLIEKVCFLSFRLLFKLDDNVTALVFTMKKLKDKPYFITNNEMNFLCKLGILSQHKVIDDVGERKFKLLFVHESFMEFYAAMYVSFFDTQNFDSVVKSWTKAEKIKKYDNFLLLLSGLCHQKVISSFHSIYHAISNCIEFSRGLEESVAMLELIQNIVIKCYTEIRTHVGINVSLKLEYFIFDKTNVDSLKQLLLLNKANVKYLCSKDGIFHDEFNEICNLEHLCVMYMNNDVPVENDDRFNELIERNKAYYIVGIAGSDISTSIPTFSIRAFRYMTTLYLNDIQIQQECIHDITDYLSNNDNIQSISLNSVTCSEHEICDSNCLQHINLEHSKNIENLDLSDVNIIVTKINKSCLKSVTLIPLSKNIAKSYIDLFKCIGSSGLECLDVHGEHMLDDSTVKDLIGTIKTLSCIKTIKLDRMTLPDNIYVQSNVRHLHVKMSLLIMTDTSFESFIECCTRNKTHINVELDECKIRKYDGDDYRDMSDDLSVNYMHERLKDKPHVKITYENCNSLHFELQN